MRYQQTLETHQPRSGVDNGMLVGTTSYAPVLGIGMVAVGRWARQRWLAFWARHWLSPARLADRDGMGLRRRQQLHRAEFPEQE